MGKAGYRTLPTGKAFGVINVFTEVGEYEIATMREDIGSGRRPDGVRFADIETDARRRDLTINALYYDIDKGEIVDLVGVKIKCRKSIFCFCRCSGYVSACIHSVVICVHIVSRLVGQFI